MCHPSSHWTSNIESYCRLFCHGHLHMLSSFKFFSWHTSPAEWQRGYKSWCSSSEIKARCDQAACLHLSVCAFKIGAAGKLRWCRQTSLGLSAFPSSSALWLHNWGEWERRSLWRAVPSFEHTLRLPLAESGEECMCTDERVCVCTRACVWSWQRGDPSTEDVLRLWGSVYRLLWLQAHEVDLPSCLRVDTENLWKRMRLIYLPLRYFSAS